MNLSRLRLITFDVTDTLLQFRTAPGKQYGEIGAMYGILCDKDDLAYNFKEKWREMNKQHPNFGKATGIGWQQWWKMVVFGTFKDVNVEEKKLEAISNHLIDAYKTSACWQQSYGALGLLSFLKNQSVTLGVISNFDERLSITLQNTKLRHYFKFVLTSYEAGFEKPDKKIFEEAIKISEIPNLRAEECLHVGDRVRKDYYGAKNAGWHAVLVDERTPEQIKKMYPDIEENNVFRNLYDLHKYFNNVDENETPNK